jgi:integrase
MGIKVGFREHVEKSGHRTLYVRFKIPEYQKDGSIRERYVERSARTRKKVEARQFAEAEYERACEEARRMRDGELSNETFAAAARGYMLNGGSRQYLFPIIECLGLKKLSEIDQLMVSDLSNALYPGRSAATVNRQLYTPIIAVMNFAKHQHRLERPKGHDSFPALDVPRDDWYPAVLRVANPWVRAFLITGRMHGRRPGELLNRTREHFDTERGTLLVYDRKGDQHILIELAGPALVAIKALPDLRDAVAGVGVFKRLTRGMRNALFGTFRKETMRVWLRDACKEAGVRYHMPKEAGRHAFVTKNLQAGKSLKWVQDAGRWKTLKVPAEKYGHLELQEVDREARRAGEDWFAKIFSEPLQIKAAAPERKEFLGDGIGDGRKKRA